MADDYLLAHVPAHVSDVVVYEIAANSGKEIKIPNAGSARIVKFLGPYEMLRKEKIRFVSGRPA